ncbi:MAG TPA: DUF881 domain-containing protein [Chloroflexia bacterium]|nr:DUF881 domain-containing protein [Chloroflexia bacterium]
MAEVTHHKSEEAARPAGAGIRAHPVEVIKTRFRQSAGLMGLSITLLVGGLVGGALLSTRWQAQPQSDLAVSSPITRQSEPEIVAATISRLEAEQADLKVRIADLRRRIGELQSAGAQGASSLNEVNGRMEQARIASGMTALEGRGIVVTLNDSSDSTMPPHEDPGNYIIHDYDLRDVLNALWAAGAEAISLNGERLVSTSSLYCVGTTILCNATRLSPPYEVRAIGDPEALEAAVRNAPQMEKLNQRALIYDIPISVEQQEKVEVPAYNGSVVFRHAEVDE